MKLILLSVFALFIGHFSFAQYSAKKDYEVGITLGGAWYNGDLNPNKQLSPDHTSVLVGANVRKNLNRRWAMNFSGNYSTLKADDSNLSSTISLNRNLNFETRIYELTGMIQFNFVDFDATYPGMHFTPYMNIGLGMFYFNPLTVLQGNVYELRPYNTEGQQKSYSRLQPSMPFGFGMKWAPSSRFIVSVDWIMRKTFTDYLDDVSTVYPNEGALDGVAEDLSDRSFNTYRPDGQNWGTQRGNSKNKDWFSSLSLTVGYRIGSKAVSCYFKQDKF